VLVLFTRHPDGIWEFASSLGGAGCDWQQALHEAEQARLRKASARNDTESLFENVGAELFDAKRYERDRRDGWASHIAGNICQLLDRHGDFRIIDRTVEVYGSVLGQAWERHVRQAVKELHRTGVVGIDGRYDFYRCPLVPLSVPGQRTRQNPQSGSASDPTFGPPAAGPRPSGSDRPTA
jgi:hypothetical protein